MITFICALLLLFFGYYFYGKFVERIARPTDALTPAMKHPDGVDFVSAGKSVTKKKVIRQPADGIK